MQSNPELMRQILFAVEADVNAIGPGWVDLKIEGYTDNEISYNVQLLGDAGYLLTQDLSSSSGFHVAPKRLTSAGHDFLDATRSDAAWSHVKSVTAAAGSFTLSLLKDVAIQYAKKKLGLAA